MKRGRRDGNVKGKRRVEREIIVKEDSKVK
jgi:hypothetical protein